MQKPLVRARGERAAVIAKVIVDGDALGSNMFISKDNLLQVHDQELGALKKCWHVLNATPSSCPGRLREVRDSGLLDRSRFFLLEIAGRNARFNQPSSLLLPLSLSLGSLGFLSEQLEEAH